MAPVAAAEQYMRNVAEIASQVEKHQGHSAGATRPTRWPPVQRESASSTPSRAAPVADGDLENLKSSMTRGCGWPGSPTAGGTEVSICKVHRARAGRLRTAQEALKTMVGLTPLGVDA